MVVYRLALPVAMVLVIGCAQGWSAPDGALPCATPAAGCACDSDGATHPCGTDVGACEAGVMECTSGAWTSCTGAIDPAAETCDTLDNDCDDTIDEGCACTTGATLPCGTDTGQCAAGTQTCASGMWGSCAGFIGAIAESCNGLDDDCDGVTDDGNNPCGGACSIAGSPGASCDGADSDACGDDAYACSGLNALACSTGGDNVETLNVVDDDCDGVVDEGFSVIALAHDDFTGADGNCPTGYAPRGSFKVNSVPFDPPATSGATWDGQSLYAGWLQLCSPTADVILARGLDDHTGVGGGCPNGYLDRGAFKVDANPPSGPATGVAYDGYILRSGWMHLCSSTGIEALAIGLDDDAGYSEPCPAGTSERGTWKPDVVPAGGGATSFSTGGYAMSSGWLRYCVSN